MKKGELANARRLYRLLDEALDLAEDDKAFASCDLKIVDAVRVTTKRAKRASVNVLVAYGDLSGYKVGK